MLTTLMKYAMLTTRIGRERIYLDLVSKHRRKFGFSFDMVLILPKERGHHLLTIKRKTEDTI